MVVGTLLVEAVDQFGNSSLCVTVATQGRLDFSAYRADVNHRIGGRAQKLDLAPLAINDVGSAMISRLYLFYKLALRWGLNLSHSHR